MIGNNAPSIVINSLTVREEADINKIARQLQTEVDKRNRFKGIL